MKAWAKILIAIGAVTTAACTAWIVLYLMGKKRIYYPAKRNSFSFPVRE